MSEGIAKKMCFSKRRYPSQELINKAIQNTYRYYPQKASLKLRSYQCPHCGGFHMTSAQPLTASDRFYKSKR